MLVRLSILIIMDTQLEEKESDVSRIMRELIEYYIEMEGILNEIME